MPPSFWTTFFLPILLRAFIRIPAIASFPFLSVFPIPNLLRGVSLRGVWRPSGDTTLSTDQCAWASCILVVRRPSGSLVWCHSQSP